MNSVVLSGRLTRDPELKHTPSGTAVCNMSLAVDRAGQKTDEGFDSGFFVIECWDKQAENAAQYLSKGSRCAVQGELRFRKWEKDGQTRTAVEVRAYRVEFLETRKEAEERRAGDGDYQQSISNQQDADAETSDFGGARDDFAATPADDDIPF